MIHEDRHWLVTGFQRPEDEFFHKYNTFYMGYFIEYRFDFKHISISDHLKLTLWVVELKLAKKIYVCTQARLHKDTISLHQH